MLFVSAPKSVYLIFLLLVSLLGTCRPVLLYVLELQFLALLDSESNPCCASLARVIKLDPVFQVPESSANWLITFPVP